GASDIHVEPQAREVRIRYRVDGLLRDVMTVPRTAARGLVSRIKVLSNLDIAERRVPQDGRARLSIDGSLVDTRVSTLPSVHGEKVVIRVLPRADSVPPLTTLGLDERQLEILTSTLVSPQGLVLITGPTGSGKTSTLYSAISQIRTPDRNIVTLEDPVEIALAGITQVQTHERAGLTFTRGLRSVLRQDPDVILVGEVRDAETAKLALEAALTGHLVLTTLHTNDAAAAITRLVEMGVEPYLVASSLTLVVAQRLIRLICRACAAPSRPTNRVLSLLGLSEADIAGATPQRGKGCSDCGGTGYRGRTGVYETLAVTSAMRSLLLHTPTEAAITAAARAGGVTTMRTAALAKAHTGLTTYDEVLRATRVDQHSGHRCAGCGRTLADEMVGCPWCGQAANLGRCTGCGRPLEPDWRFCPWCPEAPPRAPDTTQPTVQSTRPMAPAPSPASLPRVLVVEDDEHAREFIAMALDGVVDVQQAGTADEALSAAAEGDFDGLLLDHQLPDLAGVEVLRLLRSDPHTALLPVLMLTGSDRPGLETAARTAGADDFLTKPIEPSLLEERTLALVARSPRLAR
ncbi:MAG TPA: ATPase, T2SS/T4P/T4SS family, partial [Mycobacteriales bacterium]|nr:ATPase, T2SS/T4P/T4SS family [Mycobacteriales bacterium]